MHQSFDDMDYYLKFDPIWDETLDYILMLPEIGDNL